MGGWDSCSPSRRRSVSKGSRRQAIPWYRWVPCTFDDGFAICVLLVQQADGELLQTGFVHDDGGELHQVRRVDLQSRYDAQGYPCALLLSLEGEEGECWEVEGE